MDERVNGEGAGSDRIETVEQLRALYGAPGEAALVKVRDRLLPSYRLLIEASPFVALATYGPEGLDCSPRGDRGAAVHVEDDRTLMIPDRRGNNRVDSLLNIVRDGRVALLFLIPGCDTTLRVNGRAHLSVAGPLLARFTVEGHAPRSIVVVEISEVYFQCARAVMRAELWSDRARVDPRTLPSAGQMLEEARAGFDAEAYDREWPGRAARSMW